MALFGTYFSCFMSMVFVCIFMGLLAVLWWSKQMKAKFPKLCLIQYKKIELVKPKAVKSVNLKTKKAKKLK